MRRTEKESQQDPKKALAGYAAVSRADRKPEYTLHREACGWMIHKDTPRLLIATHMELI